MRRWRAAFGLVVTTLLLATAGAAGGMPVGGVAPSGATGDLAAVNPSTPAYAPGQVIVVFRRGATRAQRAQVRRTLGATEALGAPRSPSLPDMYLWDLPRGLSVASAVARLRANGAVKWIQPNYLYRLCFTPNDTLFGEQWSLHNTGQTVNGVAGVPDADIDALEAWDIERGFSSPVTVAVIDTGTDLGHPDLAPRLWTNEGEIPGNEVDDDGNGYVDDVNGYNWAGASQSSSKDAVTVNWVAQTFRGTGHPLSWVKLALGKSTGGVATVRLCSGASGSILAQTDVAVPATGTPQPVVATFAEPVDLAEGGAYSIHVIGPSLLVGSHAGAPYAEGHASTWTYDDGWQEESYDLYFVTNPHGTPHDDRGHGTHVAGIIGAASNDSHGVAGVAAARIMTLKVIDAGGGTTGSFDFVNALHYAVDNGADVVNMSFGSTNLSEVDQEAVEWAAAQGLMLVASSGNSGDKGSPTQYPAAFSGVTAVGATDNTDAVAAFSTRNAAVDVSAPGVDVLSTFPGGSVLMSGTSMASPTTAGLAALVLAHNPQLTPAEVESLIEANAEDLGPSGRDDAYGHGRINAFATLQATPPPPYPSGTVRLQMGSSYTEDRTVSVDSAVSDASELRWSLDGTHFSAWRPYAASFAISLPDADGRWTATVEYRLVSYRTTVMSDSIILDRTAPTITSVASSTHPDQSGWYASRTPTVSWTASSDPSGVADYSWSVTAASDTVPDGAPDGTGTSTTLSSLADGVWYFHVRARDGAGHWGPGAHFKLQIDSGAPAGTMAINGGAALTNSTAAVIVSSVADTYTPAGSLQMRWSTNGGTTWSGWTTYAAAVGVTLPAGDGAREVRAQYKDLAGNAGTLIDTIQLDTTAPTIASLLSSTHPDPARWYTRTSLDLSWSPQADASGVADYSFVLDSSPATTPDNVADGATPAASFTDVAAGQRYFHVRARDVAGNWGPAAHYGVKIDLVAPSGELLLNGGDVACSDPTVWLSSSVSDDFTARGDLQMRYSVNGGTTWSSWLPYSEGFDVVLPEPDGPKTVTAQYRDLADNRREYTYDIYLDRVAPTVWAGTSEEWYQHYWVEFLAEDTGSGVAIVWYRVDGGGWRYEADGDDMAVFLKTWKRGGNSGVHTIEYYCSDRAGNESAWGQGEVLLDGKAPVTTDDLPRNPATPGVPVVSSVPLTMNLTVDDPLSGVWQTWCSLDGAAFTEATSVFIDAPANGSNDGLHWLGYYSIDMAMNREPVHWVPVIIDAAP